VTRLQRIALIVILLSAVILRLTGLDWDGFQHHHPDERYITWVATTIELPSIGQLIKAGQWRPETSTFNPFHWPPEAGSEGIIVLQGQPRDFAYGHVPLYLGVAATRLAEWLAPALLPILPAGWNLTADVLNGAGQIEYHHLAVVGRFLTALIDTGTVLFTFLLGRRLYGVATGLLAAALLSVAVLHIQLAHFFTSDPYLTFFVVAAIYFMVAAHGGGVIGPTQERRRKGYFVLAAIMVGLAVGSKFTAVLLGLPLLWTAAAVAASGKRRVLALLGIALVGLTFALTNPFAVLDWTCVPPEVHGGGNSLFTILSNSCYVQNILTQNAMVSGRADLGFTRQYAGTTPYLYFGEMLIRWGLGPLLGLAALAGLVWAIWDVGRSLRGVTGVNDALHRLLSQPAVIVLLWVLPYVILTGGFYVKFLRYMQPVVPFLIVFGAALLWRVRRPSARYALVGIVLIGTALYALAFVNLYRVEHPWNVASRWIYENVPSGTLILSEQWDDFLPVNLVVDGEKRSRMEYPNAELTWLTFTDVADNEGRLLANLELLADAEYLTVLSNRVYGVAPRLPERYPLSGQYHQLLFDGALGYELVWAGGRAPRLFGVELWADTFSWPGLRPPDAMSEYLNQSRTVSPGRADESFIVYDQPLTMIFRNTGNLSVEEMKEAFKLTGN